MSKWSSSKFDHHSSLMQHSCWFIAAIILFLFTILLFTLEIFLEGNQYFSDIVRNFLTAPFKKISELSTNNIIKFNWLPNIISNSFDTLLQNLIIVERVLSQSEFNDSQVEYVRRDVFPVEITLSVYLICFTLLYFLLAFMVKNTISNLLSNFNTKRLTGGQKFFYVFVKPKNSIPNQPPNSSSKFYSFLDNTHFTSNESPLSQNKPIIYSPEWILISGILILLLGIFWLNNISYQNQTQSFYDIPKESFLDVTKDEMEFFVKQSFNLPFHLKGSLLDYLPLTFIFIGLGLLQFLNRSLVPAKTQFITTEKTFPVPAQVSYLNLFLNHLYLKYGHAAYTAKQFRLTELQNLYDLPSAIKPHKALINENTKTLTAVYKHTEAKYTATEPFFSDQTEQLKPENIKKKDILKKLLHINNMDMRYESQNLAIKKYMAKENFVLSSAHYSGKTRLLNFLIAYSVIADLKTVLVIVPDYPHSMEIEHIMRKSYGREAWFSSITIRSYQESIEQGSSLLSPDILFITPYHLHDMFSMLPKWRGYLGNLGLLLFLELHEYRDMQLIHSSFIVRRLLALLSRISIQNDFDKLDSAMSFTTRNQSFDLGKNFPVVGITMNAFENAAEICNSFFGKILNFSTKNVIRSSATPATERRILLMTVKSENDPGNMSQVLPLAIARDAIEPPFNLSPIFILGFSDNLTISEKNRIIADLQGSQELFEKNVYFSHDLHHHNLTLENIPKWLERKRMVHFSPLVIGGGNITDLLQIMETFSNISLLRNGEKPVLILLSTNERQEILYRYFLNSFAATQITRPDCLTMLRFLEVPIYSAQLRDPDKQNKNNMEEYVPAINKIVKYQIISLMLDQYNFFEKRQDLPGFTADEIIDIISLDDKIVRNMLAELEQKKTLLLDSHQADFQDIKIETEKYFINHEEINEIVRNYSRSFTFLDSLNDWAIIDSTSGGIIHKIDSFDQKTFFLEGTIHIINNVRYRVSSISTEEKRIYVENETSVLKTQIVMKVQPEQNAEETIKHIIKQHLKDEITFSKKIKEGNSSINSDEGYNNFKVDKRTRNDAIIITVRTNTTIPVQVKIEEIIYWNPISGRIINRKPISEKNLSDNQDKKPMYEELDSLFVLLPTSQNVLQQENKIEFEKTLYESLEFLFEAPEDKLICQSRTWPNLLTDNNIPEKQIPWVLLEFYSRTKYRSNILQKIEDDILGNNALEKSLILEYLNYDNLHKEKKNDAGTTT